MNQSMTLDEMKAHYDSEWVLVEDPELDEDLEVKRGTVLHHSKSRSEVYRKALELRPRRPAFVFTGRVPAEGKVLAL